MRDVTIILQVQMSEVNYLMTVLGQRPWAESHLFLEKVGNQVEAQLNPPPIPEPPEPPQREKES